MSDIRCVKVERVVPNALPGPSHRVRDKLIPSSLASTERGGYTALLAFAAGKVERVVPNALPGGPRHRVRDNSIHLDVSCCRSGGTIAAENPQRVDTGPSQ